MWGNTKTEHEARDKYIVARPRPALTCERSKLRAKRAMKCARTTGRFFFYIHLHSIRITVTSSDMRLSCVSYIFLITGYLYHFFNYLLLDYCLQIVSFNIRIYQMQSIEIYKYSNKYSQPTAVFSPSLCRLKK